MVHGRSLGRGLAGACVTVALVTAGACSAKATHPKAKRGGAAGGGPTTAASQPPARSTTTRSTRSTPSATAIDAPATEALRAHLIAAVAGYPLQPAGRTGTGPSTLVSAAADAGGGSGASGAAERAALTNAGFRAGYKLLFSSGDRELLEAAYRFASAVGAQRYANRAFAARVHDGGAPSARAPAGVPGARVVERKESDSSSALVLFTHGPTLVILSTFQPPGTDATALLDPIAVTQYQLLANY